MDFANFRVRLPEPKAIKIRYLMAERELQYGNQQMRMRLVRELSGFGAVRHQSMPLQPSRRSYQ